MKKTVKRKVSILMALIMLFLPIGNISIAPVLGYTNTVYAETENVCDEIERFIGAHTYGMVMGLYSGKSYLEETIKYDKEAGCFVVRARCI